ncbi:hypothetical protein, partial [Acetonema longum]
TVAEMNPPLETPQVPQVSSQSQPNPAESSTQNGDATINTLVSIPASEQTKAPTVSTKDTLKKIKAMWDNILGADSVKNADTLGEKQGAIRILFRSQSNFGDMLWLYEKVHATQTDAFNAMFNDLEYYLGATVVSDIQSEAISTQTSAQGTGKEINQILYNNNAVYKHETDLIARINSINTTKFNWDVNNFQKIYKKNKATYEEISKKTGVPPELIAALHYRESGCDFTTYLHNGDPLGKPTTHVPEGKNFNNFTDAAVDALLEKSYIRDKYGLSANSDDMAAMMAFAESYNGLGYYQYHKDTVSPYVYSGTNVYQKGKYDWDSHYNPTLVDAQPGVYLLINSLKK